MAQANALNNPLLGSTGTGQFVGDTAPTVTSGILVTPDIGTPTAGNLTSCTNLPISTGVSGLGTGVGTFLATPSSANLAAALTDETGTGAAVFANTPTLVTPEIGAATGTSLVATSLISVNGNNVLTTVQRTIFTSSGTYNAPSNLEFALVEVIGGGGGAGGTPAISSPPGPNRCCPVPSVNGLGTAGVSALVPAARC